jgi:hypothetical protein
MALSYKARRRWSLFVLVFGLPIYAMMAWGIIGMFDRPPMWLELIVYVSLGVIWTFPLKAVFNGVGKADPDEDQE